MYSISMKTQLKLIASFIVFVVMVCVSIFTIRNMILHFFNTTPEHTTMLSIKSDSENDIQKICFDIIRNSNPSLNNDLIQLTANSFIEASEKYDIPLYLLLSIAYQESRFSPSAVNHKTKCYGIMQVNVRVWSKKLRVTKQDLLNPRKNIMIGAYILKYYKDMSGTWEQAVLHYYGVDDFSKNVYAPTVLKRAKQFREILYGGDAHDRKHKHKSPC